MHAESGEDVYVRRSAIAKSKRSKRYSSLLDGEEVQFVMRKGEKGWEASHVTGPNGKCVKGRKEVRCRLQGPKRKPTVLPQFVGIASKEGESVVKSVEPKSARVSQYLAEMSLPTPTTCDSGDSGDSDKQPQLSREEESRLLYVNKFTRRIFASPNVIAMSYTHEVRKGVKTGRKVLQVGVIKKLRRKEVKRPDIRIPSKIRLSKELTVPVQVVEEGQLEVHLKKINPGAKLLDYEEKNFGTLGARVMENDGSYRLWSCAHVLTDFDHENIGKSIKVAQNPTSLKDFDGSLGWRVGGHLRVGQLYMYGGEKHQNASQDIAWAEVDPVDLIVR